MKTGIHPKYIDEALIKCACGNVVAAGSTTPEIHTEICSACHPFYTGKQKLLDTAGKVDKFMARVKKAQEHKAKMVKKVEEDEENEEETSTEVTEVTETAEKGKTPEAVEEVAEEAASKEEAETAEATEQTEEEQESDKA